VTEIGPSRDEPLLGTSYELFILLLSILSLGNLLVVNFLPPAATQVIWIIDGVLSFFFLGDFLVRLRRWRPRRAYLLGDWGWADLLAIMPVLRIFRLFRMVRVVNGLRRMGGPRIVAEAAGNRTASAFGLTVFLVILVVELAGASIVTVEGTSPDANIRNGSDAVWWAYVTITTVGYGDRYPVTNEGRVLGVLLLTAGVALFSVLTGYVANFFLAPTREGRRLRARRPVDPNGDFAALAQLLDEQDQRSRELRERIAQLQSAALPPGTSGGDADTER
jgi:voltage-gated potassium channel